MFPWNVKGSSLPNDCWRLGTGTPADDHPWMTFCTVSTDMELVVDTTFLSSTSSPARCRSSAVPHDDNDHPPTSAARTPPPPSPPILALRPPAFRSAFAAVPGPLAGAPASLPRGSSSRLCAPLSGNSPSMHTPAQSSHSEDVKEMGDPRVIGATQHAPSLTLLDAAPHGLPIHVRTLCSNATVLHPDLLQ
ncbi:hypothetical protein FB451DRAFT_1395779 [Mycena latifolia]|nr:hypothetical protein FB451DRAFT_1395779 [Mycena latifolia]